MKKITAIFMSLVLIFSFGIAPAMANEEAVETSEETVMTVNVVW